MKLVVKKCYQTDQSLIRQKWFEKFGFFVKKIIKLMGHLYHPYHTEAKFHDFLVNLESGFWGKNSNETIKI